MHLLDVINDVLDISKAEAVEISVHLSDVDLGKLFADVEVLASGLAAHASIGLEFRVGGRNSQSPIVVRADRTRLKQAVLNQFTNGIKFNSAGGIVSVRAFCESEIVRIEVRDTGIGMKPGEVEEAFQPFVQLDTGHARKYLGTGLGLPLTKVLIEAMKGTISVQSEPGVGSCVTIALPRGV